MVIDGAEALVGVSRNGWGGKSEKVCKAVLFSTVLVWEPVTKSQLILRLIPKPSQHAKLR